MKIMAAIFTALLLFGAAQAQPSAQPGSAKANYMSVMSKAGTPTPHPSVPVRTVSLPAGAQTGYDYYYGYGGYGVYGGGYAPSLYDKDSSSSSSNAIPGYETRPRQHQEKSKDNHIKPKRNSIPGYESSYSSSYR